MGNLQDTFERCKRSLISVFSICMTVPLNFIFTLLRGTAKKCEKQKLKLIFILIQLSEKHGAGSVKLSSVTDVILQCSYLPKN